MINALVDCVALGTVLASVIFVILQYFVMSEEYKQNHLSKR